MMEDLVANEFPGYDIELFHGEASQGIFENVEYPFIAIIPTSYLTLSCST